MSEKHVPAVNPVSAAEALALWDAGGSLPAFQVEAKPERQGLVWAAAFDLLRGEEHDHSHLSERERDVAVSIATVAKEKGWARMVSEHIHAKSPAITLTKPKDDEETQA